jgi:hypothetical protein
MGLIGITLLKNNILASISVCIWHTFKSSYTYLRKGQEGIISY